MLLSQYNLSFLRLNKFFILYHYYNANWWCYYYILLTATDICYSNELWINVTDVYSYQFRNNKKRLNTTTMIHFPDVLFCFLNKLTLFHSEKKYTSFHVNADFNVLFKRTKHSPHQKDRIFSVLKVNGAISNICIVVQKPSESLTEILAVFYEKQPLRDFFQSCSQIGIDCKTFFQLENVC